MERAVPREAAMAHARVVALGVQRQVEATARDRFVVRRRLAGLAGPLEGGVQGDVAHRVCQQGLASDVHLARELDHQADDLTVGEPDEVSVLHRGVTRHLPAQVVGRRDRNVDRGPARKRRLQDRHHAVDVVVGGRATLIRWLHAHSLVTHAFDVS